SSTVELLRANSVRPYPAGGTVQILDEGCGQNLLHRIQHSLRISAHGARTDVVVRQRLRHSGEVTQALQTHPHIPVLTRPYVLTEAAVPRQRLSPRHNGGRRDRIAITQHLASLCRTCPGAYAAHSLVAEDANTGVHEDRVLLQ